ncbi:YcbK family protein [Falsiroseomonas sp. HW251]|uniref:YcbK family protein n=1 Tax=Falsiroseomonas sp. HW251 TaxID=3390998 RepID=UPI003D31C14A
MRRSFLLGGTAAFCTLLLPRAGRAADAKRITLKHQGTGARFNGIWHDGRRADPQAMADLSACLADAGCNPPLPFDADTIEIVWEVAARTRLGEVLDVHSGYRTPAVNRAVNGAGDSQHLRAGAMDIGVPAGRLPAVAETALKLAKGGVGVYRTRGFVHLDSGPVRTWTDGGDGVPVDMSPRGRELSRIASAWNPQSGRSGMVDGRVGRIGGRPLRIDTRLPTGW